MAFGIVHITSNFHFSNFPKKIVPDSFPTNLSENWCPHIAFFQIPNFLFHIDSIHYIWWCFFITVDFFPTYGGSSVWNRILFRILLNHMPIKNWTQTFDTNKLLCVNASIVTVTYLHTSLGRRPNSMSHADLNSNWDRYVLQFNQSDTHQQLVTSIHYTHLTR